MSFSPQNPGFGALNISDFKNTGLKTNGERGEDIAYAMILLESEQNRPAQAH
jgi:hypothetical protein